MLLEDLGNKFTEVDTVFSVFYGIQNHYIDVTYLALLHGLKGNMLFIPATDVRRAELFGDPVFGVLKHILIKYGKFSTIYPADQSITLNIDNGAKIETNKLRGTMAENQWWSGLQPTEKLAYIHHKLKFVGGTLAEEYPEQLMTTAYLPPEAKVLELGSNIGRNTLVIASILYDSRNLVTLECDPNSCAILDKNKSLNGYEFHIENAALSYRKLIQQGWNTIPSETLLPGHASVKVITFEELEKKYQIQFDTIVADCEGALYYILSDHPNLLNNIKLLIVENDYTNLHHHQYVATLFINKGFTRVYFAPGPTWASIPEAFYEVWRKI